MTVAPTVYHRQHQLLGDCVITNLPDLDHFAAELCDHLPAVAALGLCGTLGAGKTQLVQSFAKQIGLDAADVTSPTFTLMQQYQAKRMLYHLDLYRVTDQDELWELGIEELFEQQAVVMIEWADRFASSLPVSMLWLTIQIEADDQRRCCLSGLPDLWGRRIGSLLAAYRHG